jgi:hypothetical protein
MVAIGNLAAEQLQRNQHPRRWYWESDSTWAENLKPETGRADYTAGKVRPAWAQTAAARLRLVPEAARLTRMAARSRQAMDRRATADTNSIGLHLVYGLRLIKPKLQLGLVRHGLAGITAAISPARAAARVQNRFGQWVDGCSTSTQGNYFSLFFNFFIFFISQCTLPWLICQTALINQVYNGQLNECSFDESCSQPKRQARSSHKWRTQAIITASRIVLWPTTYALHTWQWQVGTGTGAGRKMTQRASWCNKQLSCLKEDPISICSNTHTLAASNHFCYYYSAYLLLSF